MKKYHFIKLKHTTSLTSWFVIVSFEHEQILNREIISVQENHYCIDTCRDFKSLSYFEYDIENILEWHQTTKKYLFEAPDFVRESFETFNSDQECIKVLKKLLLEEK